MAVAVINNSDNINIPHGVSAWFQKDFTGEFLELGDLAIDGVTLTPEFVEFESYRSGTRGIRKKILTTRAASVSTTLNEASVVNLQRMIYGGAVASGQSKTALEGREMTIEEDTDSLFVDIATAEPNITPADISVTGIFAETDILEASSYTITGGGPLDTAGKCRFSGGGAAGDTVYVKYSITTTSLYSSEIFGSADATIEGAVQLQARNQNGGIFQIWDLASVQLAPNGDISYPLDAIQTLPMLLTLQERGGTFGTIYIK